MKSKSYFTHSCYGLFQICEFLYLSVVGSPRCLAYVSHLEFYYSASIRVRVRISSRLFVRESPRKAKFTGPESAARLARRKGGHPTFLRSLLNNSRTFFTLLRQWTDWTRYICVWAFINRIAWQKLDYS